MTKFDFYLTSQDIKSKKIRRTLNAQKELEKFYKCKSNTIKNGKPSENGIFKLDNGKVGLILTNDNNTNSGKINIIKDIIKSEGSCLLFVPWELRVNRTVKRFVVLADLALPELEIIDPVWLKPYSEANSVVDGKLFRSLLNIKMDKSKINVHYSCRNFYFPQEVELLCIILKKHFNKDIFLEGKITADQFNVSNLLELENHNINYNIIWNNTKTNKSINYNHSTMKKILNNDKNFDSFISNTNIESNIHLGENKIEQTQNEISSQSSLSSRIITNKHQNLCISFSNKLREKNVKTIREYLNIDVLAIYESKLEIYEIKTSNSEIYKAIGQLFSYKYRLEQEKPYTQINMNLVLSKDCNVSNEFTKILNSLKINIFFE